jgi:hypothetical protein
MEARPEPSNHFFIVESDLEILKAAFEARNLESILSHPHVCFAWPISGPELAEQWRAFFDPVYAQKSAFITHFSSVALNAPFFKSTAEIIQSQTFQIFTDINTLVAKSQEFLENFARNMIKASRAPGVIGFSGAFPGIPAVIVSAGPSLDRNIHELRGWAENLLILSTDTALKPLLSAGIDPHFILTGDPSHANYLHLKNAPSKDALLVAEATSFPSSFEDFDGRTISCIYENSSLRSLADLLGNKGTLRAWGSVATMALDFALLAGCNPIIFIGQDLAHTGGKVYCSGVYFEDDWYARISNPDEFAAQLVFIRNSRRTVSIEDAFGNPAESTDKMVAYWNWFGKIIGEHKDRRFINATEGGILRNGVEIVSLREALNHFCRKNLNLRKRVKETFARSLDNNCLYSNVNLSILFGELAAVKDALKRGFRLCGKGSSGQPQELLKRLESTKETLYFNPHTAPLLDCLNQMGTVTFLRKRRTLFDRGSTASELPKIKTIYMEYFSSVKEAVEKIEQALSAIEKDNNPESWSVN